MDFCNISFNTLKKRDIFEPIDDKVKILITVSASHIVDANTLERFFSVLKDNYVCFDGQVPYLLARIISKNKDFEKLSGSDIVYDFCSFARNNGYKVFFLGGNSESNRLAVDKMREQYEISISGYSPDFESYPFSNAFTNSCLGKIKDFKPDIMFVGFGAPKQEFWADDNKEFLFRIGVKYVICSGGTFDFIARRVKRAPVFMQKMGLEGLYRFFQEPNMMRFKRLTKSLKFFKYLLCSPDFRK